VGGQNSSAAGRARANADGSSTPKKVDKQKCVQIRPGGRRKSLVTLGFGLETPLSTWGAVSTLRRGLLGELSTFA
jgi:hypothetical protein